MKERTSIELLSDADLDEVEAVLRSVIPGVLRWAHGRLPPWARHRRETADLVQEAALGALEHLPREDLGNEAAVRGYVCQSVRNRIIDEIRRTEIVELGFALSAGPDVDPSPSPLECAIESQDRRRFRYALGLLDEDSRVLIVGRVDLGMSYEELAAATGRRTAETARVATNRAVARLAKKVGELPPDWDRSRSRDSRAGA